MLFPDFLQAPMIVPQYRSKLTDTMATLLSPEERDFIGFVRRHTDRLDADWMAIQRGERDIAAALNPIFARLEVGADEATALLNGYTGDLASYVRASNAHIQERMNLIAQNAAARGVRIEDRFLAGRFPTQSFNAQASREGSTYLLLIHTGFSQFVTEASRIVFAIHNLLFVNPDERWPEPSWLRQATLDDLVNCFADLVRSFVVDPTPATVGLDQERYPFEPERELPAFAASVAAQDFALAHELGHLALGHLQRALPRSARCLRGGLRVLSKIAREEHEADVFAGQILFEQKDADETQAVLDRIYGKYIGIGLFFDLDALVAEVERITFDLPPDEPEQSHPPARRREAVLLRGIRKGAASGILFADRRAMGRTFQWIRETALPRLVPRMD